jgi:Rrf2 family protein
MQITHQADYAIRTMVYLAGQDPNRKIATSQIAKFYQIPPSFLTKIVSQLSIAGLLRTSRGARGGVSLARAPEEISLLNVLEAIDGPVLMNECVSDAHVCPFKATCKIHVFWVDTQKEVSERLAGTNLADLATKEAVFA